MRRFGRIRRNFTFVVVLLVALSIFVFIFHTFFIFFLSAQSSDLIVSLTTTPRRFHVELPVAIHSLLSQTTSPKEIRVYLTRQDRTDLTLISLKRSVQRLCSLCAIGKLFDRLVRLEFVEEDFGPATKFLPIIREFHRLGKDRSDRIIICDDDHYYHPHSVSTLDEYSKIYPRSIVGFRGWRIREDLNWGVSNAVDLAYHIIESSRLGQVYHVGIVTANHAYLIRPSFFDSDIYENFFSSPPDVHRMDDIWIHGHAAKRNISRLIVPSSCRQISVTRTHELENYLLEHHFTRSSANDHALQWFKTSWEQHLWYRFSGENQPIYCNPWTKFVRQWFHLIIEMKLFFLF